MHSGQRFYTPIKTADGSNSDGQQFHQYQQNEKFGSHPSFHEARIKCPEVVSFIDWSMSFHWWNC
jgi:hypothetical protein